MANKTENYDAVRDALLSQLGTPRASTKKEFLALPENRSLKKSILTGAIICYIGAVLSGVMGFLFPDIGPYIFVDVAIMFLLGLGVHLKQSKLCAIALLVYAVASCVLTAISTGKFSSWLIIMAGVYAVSATFKLDKLWKEYLQRGR